MSTDQDKDTDLEPRKFRFYYLLPDGKKYYHCDSLCSMREDSKLAEAYTCPPESDPEEHIATDQKNIIWRNFSSIFKETPNDRKPEFLQELSLEQIELVHEEIPSDEEVSDSSGSFCVFIVIN